MNTYAIIENNIVTNIIVADKAFVLNYQGTLVQLGDGISARIGDTYNNGEFISSTPITVPSEVKSALFQSVLFSMGILDLNDKLNDDQKDIYSEAMKSETIQRSSQVCEIIKNVYQTEDSVIDKIFIKASKMDN